MKTQNTFDPHQALIKNKPAVKQESQIYNQTYFI